MESVQTETKKNIKKIEHQLLKAFHEKEEELDTKIEFYNKLSEDELEEIREKRRKELKQKYNNYQTKLSNGHGKYEEVHERDIFDISKLSDKLVVHFYRPTTRRCEIVDSHLQTMAKSLFDIKFIKIHAEKAHFLANRLNVSILPTITLIKNGVIIHHIVGFDEFGGTDDFPTSVFKNILKKWEMLD